MSDEQTERITILLQARDKELARAMDRMNRLVARNTRAADRNVQRMERNVNRRLDSMGQRAAAFGRNFIRGLGVGAATAALTGMATGLRNVVRGIADVGNQARRSGLGLEAFQEWRFVAEQTRIPIDALVDGFKELNLRADEYLTNGGGSAAEAFARLGFSGDDLARRLENPSELLLEIIGRLERFDDASQIRITDELFGGTAGEQFVELLSRGNSELREMMTRAHEVGAVMSEQMIERADEIDRRFSEITQQLSRWGQEIVVGWAMIGETIADALTTDEAEESLERQRDLMAAFVREARDLSQNALLLSDAAEAADDARFADAFANLAEAADILIQAFDRGDLSADQFRTSMTRLIEVSDSAVDAVSSIDDVTLDNAGRVIDGLKARLGELGAVAQAAAAQTAAALAMDSGTPLYEQSGPLLIQDHLGGRRTQAPRRAPPMLGEPPAPPSSGGGGGGGRSLSGYAGAVADIRARTEALNAEAASLALVAASGREYGDAIEYARRRAELMVEAQRAGREITPELQAEIDQLAEAYVTAGDSAEQAAERLDRLREHSERGIEAATDVFMAITQGGDRARQTLVRLLLEMARIRAMRGFSGGNGGKGGGFMSFLGSLLSFDGGGHTGTGSRTGGVDGKGGFPAILHPNETVIDHTKAQPAAARQQAQEQRLHVSVSMDDNGNLRAMVQDEAGRTVAQAAPGIRQGAVQDVVIYNAEYGLT